jgi:hypothetical protein
MKCVAADADHAIHIGTTQRRCTANHQHMTPIAVKSHRSAPAFVGPVPVTTDGGGFRIDLPATARSGHVLPTQLSTSRDLIPFRAVSYHFVW